LNPEDAAIYRHSPFRVNYTVYIMTHRIRMLSLIICMELHGENSPTLSCRTEVR
jgi:hypothetical protein